MNDNIEPVGNETAAPDAAQDNSSTDTRVNPGVIRKSTTQSILRAASQATGQEFESVDAMLAALARMSVQSTVAPQQPVEVAPQKNRLTNTDLAEQFQSLKSELAQKEQALRERELDSEIRMAMGDRFDSDLVDYALSKVRANIQWQDGAYSIVNSKGQIRYDSDGNPMTIQSLVAEVAKSNPKLLRQAASATPGSGLRPRQGMFGGEAETMPDYATDPAGFNAWAARNGLGKGTGLKGNFGVKVSQSTNTRRVV